jgi:hypothetical protein
MPAAHDFVANLALVLCVAAATTLVFQRLRQPVVFGYLLAGLIVGPHVPIPLVADEAMVHALAELGVIRGRLSGVTRGGRRSRRSEARPETPPSDRRRRAGELRPLREARPPPGKPWIASGAA